jgi:hypothetical protein
VQIHVVLNPTRHGIAILYLFSISAFWGSLRIKINNVWSSTQPVVHLCLYSLHKLYIWDYDRKCNSAPKRILNAQKELAKDLTALRIYNNAATILCRCGRFPPEVRTAIPVEGRFEHIVLSCSTTADHGIIWIERESTKALEVRRILY